MKYFLPLLIVVFCFLSGCATLPDTTSSTDLTEILYPPELNGVRWGVLVADLDGNVLLEHNASQRFLPASNTKLLTTAAAFQWMDQFVTHEANLSTRVYLETNQKSESPNVVILGAGDPDLSDGTDCAIRCLGHFAQSIADTGVLEINDIIADASWFADEKWAGGWSWEDLQEGYGTAVSALTLNRNELNLLVSPAKHIGGRAYLSLLEDDGYYQLHSDIRTVESDAKGVVYERIPGSRTLRISGQMELGDRPYVIRLGVDEPSERTAFRLRRRLVEKGVKVVGDIRLEKQEIDHAIPNQKTEECSGLSETKSARYSNLIATLPPPDWYAALKVTNKESQNLFAEILLRQLGKICGNGDTSGGIEMITQLLDAAGADANGYNIFDGSGMSVYNRLSPETLVKLLTYARGQEWGRSWQETFPVGGVDGGLKRRFEGTSLDRRIFAKTGTLKGVNALSGYMLSSQGKTLAFSIIANDRPLSIRTSTPFMDAALIHIAEQF